MTRAGKPCRAAALPGSNPPHCAAHGGTGKKPGAPAPVSDPQLTDPSTKRNRRNQNARKHGFYASYEAAGITIDDVLADLAAKQAALSDYIDAHLTAEDADLAALTHLFELHAQTASRLGRLLRDKRALTGEAADGIAGAIAQALDELATELQADI